MNRLLININTSNYKKFIKKCFEYNIHLIDIKYIDKNNINVLITYDDYDKLMKYLKYYDIKIIKYFGKDKIKKYFKNNYVFIISILISLIIMFICSNIIIDVEVIHSNKKIKDIIYTELDKYNIKKYTFKKSYKQIQQIKNKILEDYKKNIEWIEIDNVGMTYKVYIEERIINDIKDEKEYCNVIAIKDGIVTKIISSKGNILVNNNKNVLIGDILISGDINESKVCASGTVYAEVWYTVNISLPLNYEERILTNKKRYNISYKKGNTTNKIFRSKYSNYNLDRKELFNLFNIKIFLDKEHKVNIKKRKYNEKEAIKKAIELADNKFNIKFVEKERIMYKNVLKKEVINSTMELEIFYAIEEIISKVE